MEKKIGRIFKGDKVIWMVFFFLCMISIVEVFSASSGLTYKSQNYIGPIVYHAGTIIVGVVVAIVTLNIPCRYFKLMTPFLMLISLITLLWVLLAGTKVGDAGRWINLFGFTFQPSEIAKGTVVLIVAQILAAMQREGGHSSTYLFVTEAGGDMAVAINDMDICAALTPDFFEGLLPKLRGYGAAVLDANLPAESIAWLCAHLRAPIYADTVSAAKANRLLPQLKRLRALKTNTLEAEALTGERDPERAAAKLARLCPGRVFLSLGADGMIAAERDRLLVLPVYETEVVNTTGAGDAAAAAIVWADRKGFDLRDTAQLAQLAGSITCRSVKANNEELSALPHLM